MECALLAGAVAAMFLRDRGATLLTFLVTNRLARAIIRTSRLCLDSQMEIRALIKTRKRKRAILLLAFAVFGVALWVILGGGRKPSDEEKYRRLVRSSEWRKRWFYLETRRRWPRPLENALQKLEVSSEDTMLKLAGELSASGYFVTFTVTNSNANSFVLRSQLGTTCYWSFYEKSNVVFMTCRPNDAPRIRALIEKKP
jgi:hypothetical protein